MAILYKKPQKFQPGGELAPNKTVLTTEYGVTKGANSVPLNRVSLGSLAAAMDGNFAADAGKLAEIIGTVLTKQMSYINEPEFARWVNSGKPARQYDSNKIVGRLWDKETGNKYPMTSEQFLKGMQYLKSVTGNDAAANSAVEYFK